jgi:hypothetical protein
MNIMRVVRDDVEFYTIVETGESGMSIAGVARLCNVVHSAIRQLLKRAHGSEQRSKWLQRLADIDPYLAVNSVYGSTILSAEACTAIIGYYAFDSRNKTQAAAFAFEKFSYLGMMQWIQNITGWEPKPALPAANQTQAEIIEIPDIEAKLPPAEEIPIDQLEKLVQRILPEESIPTAVNPEAVIDMLQNCGFSGAGYRLYLYLEMRHLQGVQPDIATICAEARISRNTFYKLLPRIKEWSNCADWIQLQVQNSIERTIQERLHKELGGQMEAHTPVGPIDLLTKDELIEIKAIAEWKTGLGQILAKSQHYDQHSKRLHLFGTSSKLLRKVSHHCKIFEVSVTFEQV